MATLGTDYTNDDWNFYDGAPGSCYIYAVKCVAGSSGTVTDLYGHVKSGGGTIKLRIGVYADNGSGQPGSRSLDAGEVVTSNGNVHIGSLSFSITNGVTYWIGGMADGILDMYSSGSISNEMYIDSSQTYGPLPASYPAGSGGSYKFSFWGTYTPGGSATNVVMNIV